MPEPLCYLNGSLIPQEDARVGITDLGLLRGFGIYEGLTAFNGTPFRFEDHWKRFEKSAKALDLTLPSSGEEILKVMQELIAHNSPSQRAIIRMILTGGPAEGGIKHVAGRETFFIIVEKATPLPEKFYTEGASMHSYEHLRFLPEYKTTNYITAVLLQKKLKETGAVEILYTLNGTALECTGSNVFIVKEGKIITPTENILHGITRKVTLELAKDTYPIEERAVSMNELFAADEVFITSSFKNIVPIVSVDDKRIGAGAPGPITRDLMERFAQYTRNS